MDKKDVIPACLMSFQHDPSYRATLKAAMPVETHQTFESVERDGMFLPNGMLTLEAHAFIKNLNAVLPVVETSLATHGDDQITIRASNYRNGVEARRSAHAKVRQPAAPGLLKRVGSLAKAIGSETKAVVQGQPNLTAQQVAARLAVCESCNQLRSNRTCGMCGCFVDGKARFRSQACPLHKWPAR
jgi:hypothetical protein